MQGCWQGSHTVDDAVGVLHAIIVDGHLIRALNETFAVL